MDKYYSKQKISWETEFSYHKDETLEYLELSVFEPDEIYRSIPISMYEMIFGEISRSNILKLMLSKFIKKENNIDTITLSLDLIEKLEAYGEEKRETLESVLNNLNKYRRKNQKLDMQNLLESVLEMEPKKRTLETIIALKGIKPHSQSVTKQHISNVLRRKLRFSNRQPIYKPKSYNEVRGVVERALFTFRFIKDLEKSIEYLYMDEFGISTANGKTKIWLHKDESNITTSFKQYKRINVMIICSSNKILDLKMLDGNVNTKTFKNFIITFFENNQQYRSKKYALILDNARFHFCEKVRKYVQMNLSRLLYIAPNTPQHNFAEFVIGLVKKNIKHIDDIEE